MSWEPVDIPLTIEGGSLEITLKVIGLENRIFGVTHVDLEMGGTPLPGIAMYSKVDGEVSRWVTSTDWELAQQWFYDHGAWTSDINLLKAAYESSKEDH
jgi:hypothetical protein